MTTGEIGGTLLVGSFILLILFACIPLIVDIVDEILNEVKRLLWKFRD